MTSREHEVHQLRSITSNASRLEPEAHELNLDSANVGKIGLDDVAGGLTYDDKLFALKRLHYNFLEDFSDLPLGAVFMLEKIAGLSADESLEILQSFLVEHKDDVNIPIETYDHIEDLVQNKESIDGASRSLSEANSDEEKQHVKVKDSPVHELESHSGSSSWLLQVKTEAALIAFHSPYPEVRSVTDPFDDTSLPIETFRVYLVGILWTCIGTIVNQLFAERFPGIGLNTAVVQLLIYPTGVAASFVLPKTKIKLWKHEIDLNPGPWNHKEQMLATILYSVSDHIPYVSYNIHVQRLERFYNNQWADWGYQILLGLATNFMGFGLAGIMRKFAVYPIRSIWPTILPTLALNKALVQREGKATINGWSISKYRFFFFVTLGSFLWYWVPNYLFRALSTFNWINWIAPNNFNLTMVTGIQSGLGLNPLPTFDWNVINHNAPLMLPFYTTVNSYIGTFFSFFLILGLFYSNYYWTGYLPINSSALFTNTGTRYLVKSILDERSLIDKKKYEQVGPPFYSAANLIVYGSFFALYPFSIIYEGFSNHKAMWFAIKGMGNSFKNFRQSTFEGFNDPQTVMMKKYKEVADWVFFVVLVIAIILAIICVKVYPAETPVWGIFFALVCNFLFLIPLTVLYSVTGFSFGLNVLVELIVGYALPGNGLALNFIKALGYNIGGQAQSYIHDQKMSHYLKLPPRAVFRVQMISVFISLFISLGIINFMIDSFDNYCQPDNKQKFICPNSQVFYSASVLWGVIGPKKVFSGLYPIMQYAFLIGALLPIPCILFKKYGPRKVAKYFQPTVLIGGMLDYAPYNLSYNTVGLYFSIAFMYYIKNRFLPWWSKYNYVLSGGLDSGVAIAAVIVFFAVQYHAVDIEWWGNTVMDQGIEGGAGQQSLLNATLSAPEGYFGPREGHYP